ncbi:hypothetical protein [Actinosynnema sp. ALI-1.44]|nr:hypothetical protein [Actinosynnema sp. ALI-1.44]
MIRRDTASLAERVGERASLRPPSRCDPVKSLPGKPHLGIRSRARPVLG